MIRSDEQKSKKQQLSILVFGSCFMDYIAYCDRIPSPGETLTSKSFAKGFGGKGANQAVAAGILDTSGDCTVGMAGLVGDDGDGADYIANLRNSGCNVSLMRQLKGEATGVAFISVDSNGKNAIVICPNAAGRTGFTKAMGSRAISGVPNSVFNAADFRSALKKGGIFICQNEIPFQATLVALKAAHEAGHFTIFNPAPAPSPDQVQQLRPFLRYISLVTPNEHEAALMAGMPKNSIDNLASASKAIDMLRSLGAGDVIITMGANGAAVRSRDMPEAVLIQAPRVTAVDTTGAGDCFVGSLAFFMSKGLSVVEAVKRANVVAAHSVTRKGTQSSYHKRGELPASLFENFQQSKL